MYVIKLVNQNNGFSSPKYHLFQKHCCLSPACPLCDAPRLKFLNTIFCTDQVLLLCVKSCLPPLHNYSEIDGIVLLIRKKNRFEDFDTNVMSFFSVRLIIDVLVQPFLFNFHSFVYVLFDSHV